MRSFYLSTLLNGLIMARSKILNFFSINGSPPSLLTCILFCIQCRKTQTPPTDWPTLPFPSLLPSGEFSRDGSAQKGSTGVKRRTRTRLRFFGSGRCAAPCLQDNRQIGWFVHLQIQWKNSTDHSSGGFHLISVEFSATWQLHFHWNPLEHAVFSLAENVFG